MDICTLTIVTTMTLQACWMPSECTISADGSKQFCSAGFPVSCPTPDPYYICKRSDGSEYIYNREQAVVGVKKY